MQAPSPPVEPDNREEEGVVKRLENRRPIEGESRSNLSLRPKLVRD